MDKDKLYLLNNAVEAYKQGHPVVVISDTGSLLHGQETLETVVSLNLSLDACVIAGIPVDEFNNSDWPEMLEAARQVFMEDKWPR